MPFQNAGILRIFVLLRTEMCHAAKRACPFFIFCWTKRAFGW